MFRQILHVLVANDTQKIQSSDRHQETQRKEWDLNPLPTEEV